jgi:hypothetical protein
MKILHMEKKKPELSTLKKTEEEFTNELHIYRHTQPHS